MPMLQSGVFEYTGRELESMAVAVNYQRWILGLMRPFIGRTIVECGAGTGSFSALLLQTGPSSLTALEPSVNLFPLLVERLRSVDTARVGRALQATLQDVSAQIGGSGRPDSILYINVLEHIEDDGQELSSAHGLLKPGGRILLFAPAQRWLMSAMDRQMGHHRRYTKGELVRRCREAGFTVRLAKHVDLPGIVPWWIKYRLMGSTRMESGLVRLYDRAVVPLAQLVEGLIPPPVGKNVIVVGEK